MVCHNWIMETKITNTIKWVATAVTLFGAALTSLNVTPVNVYVLNVGSVLFLLWALRIKDRAMISVNFGMLAIYGFGTVRGLL